MVCKLLTHDLHGIYRYCIFLCVSIGGWDMRIDYRKWCCCCWQQSKQASSTEKSKSQSSRKATKKVRQIMWNWLVAENVILWKLLTKRRLTARQLVKHTDKYEYTVSLPGLRCIDSSLYGMKQAHSERMGCSLSSGGFGLPITPLAHLPSSSSSSKILSGMKDEEIIF